jgi:hypothetical protein
MREIVSPLDGFRSPFGGGRLSLDPDAAAYIAAVQTADGAALERSVKVALNDFVLGCKSDGIWDAIKASCVMAGARTLAGALVPLKGAAPTNFNFVSGDYDRKTGLIGDGATKYLDSNRANDADPQNNNHNAVFANFVGSFAFMTTDNGAVSGANFLGASLVRSRTATSVSWSPVAGLLATSRSVSSSYTYRAGGANVVVNQSSQLPSVSSVRLYSLGVGGAPFATHRISFYSIGESLDLALLDARVSALMTAIDGAIA